MNRKEMQKLRTEQINDDLKVYLPEETGEESILCEAMNYSVIVGGKRLRPMLLLESCKMFGGKEEDAKPFAVAMELIHTYSLVHDDLPAMDNDQFRRGNLTTHAKYGHALGILAGDGLLNYAFEVMSNAVYNGGKKEALAMKIIAEKAGIRGMIAGQTVDVCMTGKELNTELLEYINLRKTSALLAASLMAGAAVAGASSEEIRICEQVGNAVGIAFQIRDDILDVISDTKTLGKPVHSDEKNNKNTYVALMGLEKANEAVEEYSREAVRLLETLPYENEFLKELLMSLVGRSN